MARSRPHGRRLKILEAAERLMTHYGPVKTTVADIAREARVGVGTVYLEFSSKDAILSELARSRHDGILEAMRCAAAEAGGHAADKLKGVFDARVCALVEVGRQGGHERDLVRCGCDAVEHAYLDFVIQEAALVEEILRQGVEAGQLRPTLDAPRVARALLTAYAGFTPPRIFEVPSGEVRARVAVMHELVLYGVVCRGGG